MTKLKKICTERHTVMAQTVTYTLYKYVTPPRTQNGYAVGISCNREHKICRCGFEIDRAAVLFRSLISGGVTPTALQDIVTDAMEANA